jgi:hypothetical protein
VKLKPPTPLRGRKARSLVAATVAIVGFAGLAIAQTTTVAHADPTEVLVAVGSDTVQDVYNQFALDLTGNALGSYDAVNPVTQTQGDNISYADGSGHTNCSFTRPNGSGGGLSALRESLNPATTIGPLTGAALDQPGCVDIARSSSSVTDDGHQSNTGPIVFVPFGVDAVAGASGGSAAGAAYSYMGQTITPQATFITHAGDFTLVDLVNLYKNCIPVTEDGVTYDPNNTTSGAGGGTVANPTPIHLYIPQASSGTAKFWIKILSNGGSALGGCVHNTIEPVASLPAVNAGAAGLIVEEHNGTAMVADPNGFGPFSIAQWIAQSNAISNGGTLNTNDRRHGAIVQTLKGCTSVTFGSPATGTCSTTPTATGANTASHGGTLNTAFPITREVYSVVSFARVSSATDPLFSFLNANSIQDTLCNDVGTITGFGFAVAPDCGNVTTANRSAD